MCTFICLYLQRLKNFIFRLIGNIIGLIAVQGVQEPEATIGKRRVSPTLVTYGIIGDGTNTLVYEGTWKTKVAVKRIETVRINAREETALRQCDHPNVIKLLNVQSNIDFTYYVMELCNASLDRLFLEEMNPNKYRGPMPATQKDVCLQLAKGMEHIHEQRLIHRDVKPGNVLIWVDSTGVLMKWADFGFSKPVSERGTHSISGSKGTDGWRAPETCMTYGGGANGVANPIRPRGTVKSDVFSEGLVFAYYLLGGIHPFRGRYEPETQMNIVENRFNLNGIDEHHHIIHMHDIIMDMWNSDPVERISSSQVVERISNIEGWQEPSIPPSP